MGYLGSAELLILVILGIVIFLIVKAPKDMPLIFSHWHKLIGDLQTSSQQFYASIEKSLKEHELPDTVLSRVTHKEGGMLSANREYLRVTRREHVFDICAAPFAKGFFVSWWLGEKVGVILDILRIIPFLGPGLVRFFRPETYYRRDTALLFQESVHAAVLEVLDQTAKTQGLRSLAESDRKPILRDFFKR